MSEVRYAIACHNTSCGHIEDKAWKTETETEHSARTDKPLTARDRVPRYCPKCGQKWWKQATKDQLEKFDTRLAREARAAELTMGDSFDGIFKVPAEIRTSDPLVKRALANLLGPLEGDVLKAAQHNVTRIAQSGMQGDTLYWIDNYERAVQKAVNTKQQTVKA